MCRGSFILFMKEPAKLVFQFTVRVVSILLCVIRIGVSGITAQSSLCSCAQYIYLNDTGLDYVEKFRVEPDGALTEIGDAQNGAPWLNLQGDPNFNNPHGIAMDQNGYLYIGSTSPASIRKYNCAGVQVDADPNAAGMNAFIDGGFSYHHFAIGNYLYVGWNTSVDGGGTGEIRLYDLCTGTLLGCQSTAYVWGFTPGPDGYWYGTQSGTGIVRGPLDPAAFTGTPGNCNNAAERWMSRAELGLAPLGGGEERVPQGLAFDNNGNLYLSISAGYGYGPPSYLTKISPDKAILATSQTDATTETNVADGLNWSGARGVVFSTATNLIYVSTADDCVAAFDLNLQYLPAASVHTTGVFPKAIGIVTECCPVASVVDIDTIFCNASNNSVVYLQDLLPCLDKICEGSWTEQPGSTGLAYKSCNNSIEITGAAACGSFTLASAGTGANTQCGSFTVNLKVENVALNGPVISADRACANGGPVLLTATGASASGTLKYQWQSSALSCSEGFADIPGAAGPTYTAMSLTVDTYFRLIVTVEGICAAGFCSDTTDCILVATAPALSASNSAICVGAAIDLTTLINGNTPADALSFHHSQADADADANPLINTVIAPATATTYYVRNERTSGGSTCYSTTSILIEVSALPALAVVDGAVCSGGGLDLATLVTNAGGGIITYHATQRDALDATNPLASSIVVPARATNYYFRSENAVGCAAVRETQATIRAANCGTIGVTGPN
jgi:hypothetical protein